MRFVCIYAGDRDIQIDDYEAGNVLWELATGFVGVGKIPMASSGRSSLNPCTIVTRYCFILLFSVKCSLFMLVIVSASTCHSRSVAMPTVAYFHS